MISFARTFLFLTVLSFTCLVHPYSYALEIDTNVISEENISITLIESAFNDVGLTTRIDEDGDILTYIGGEKIWVRNDTSTSCVTVMGYKEFTDEADKRQKYRLINIINDRFVIVRASLTDDEERMWLDFNMPIDKGVTLDQIIGVAARFSSIIKTLHESDSDDILK